VWADAYAAQVERGDLPLADLLARLTEVRATGKATTSIEEWLLMLSRDQGATLEQLAAITAKSSKYVHGPNKRLARLTEQYGQSHDRLVALTSIYGTEPPTMVNHEMLHAEDIIGAT
jgi:hypothetical protein